MARCPRTGDSPFFPGVPLPRGVLGGQKPKGQCQVHGEDRVFSSLSPSHLGAPSDLGHSPVGEAGPRGVSQVPSDPSRNLCHHPPGAARSCFSFSFLFGCRRRWVPGPGLWPGPPSGVSAVNWFQAARAAATPASVGHVEARRARDLSERRHPALPPQLISRAKSPAYGAAAAAVQSGAFIMKNVLKLGTILQRASFPHPT